jgi:hypothetical protein
MCQLLVLERRVMLARGKPDRSIDDGSRLVPRPASTRARVHFLFFFHLFLSEKKGTEQQLADVSFRAPMPLPQTFPNYRLAGSGRNT